MKLTIASSNYGWCIRRSPCSPYVRMSGRLLSYVNRRSSQQETYYFKLMIIVSILFPVLICHEAIIYFPLVWLVSRFIIKFVPPQVASSWLTLEISLTLLYISLLLFSRLASF